MAGHWTKKEDVTGARTLKAIAWGDRLAAIVNKTSDETWDSLLPMIDEKRFVRRGNERTDFDWRAYRILLDHWAAGGSKYEKFLHRASEVGNVVYLDLDERSTAKNGAVSSLRSISIYEFDEADRIVAIDICMGFHQPQ
jgi:hypothetical protein